MLFRPRVVLLEDSSNLRIYGARPYRLVVLHGGPGAGGEMAPVARELATDWGILEPQQTAASIQGQVSELHDVIRGKADIPVVLIGWSWGATLGFIFAAHYPRLVTGLVLVSSGPFRAEYAADIMAIRQRRLPKALSQEVASLMIVLQNPAAIGEDDALRRFGEIMTQADSYDPLPPDEGPVSVRYDIYHPVSEEAARLRSSGELLRLGTQIACPVVAIHGDYDPHPWQGVAEPLAEVIGDFRLIRLSRCGHQPWRERLARDDFYLRLRDEITAALPSD